MYTYVDLLLGKCTVKILFWSKLLSWIIQGSTAQQTFDISIKMEVCRDSTQMAAKIFFQKLLVGGIKSAKSGNHRFKKVCRESITTNSILWVRTWFLIALDRRFIDIVKPLFSHIVGCLRCFQCGKLHLPDILYKSTSWTGLHLDADKYCCDYTTRCGSWHIWASATEW